MALNLIFQEEGRPEQAYTVGLLGGGQKAQPTRRKVCKTDQELGQGKGLWGEGLQAPSAALPPEPLASRFADRVHGLWVWHGSYSHSVTHDLCGVKTPWWCTMTSDPYI